MRNDIGLRELIQQSRNRKKEMIPMTVRTSVELNSFIDGIGDELSVSKQQVLLNLLKEGVAVAAQELKLDIVDEELFTATISFAYPLADGIVLIPTLIAITLFLRGEVNLLWSAVFFGIIAMVMADTIFVLEEINSIYSTGHPLDVGYLASYVLFTFGVYTQMKVFSKTDRRFQNQESMR